MNFFSNMRGCFKRTFSVTLMLILVFSIVPIKTTFAINSKEEFNRITLNTLSISINVSKNLNTLVDNENRYNTIIWNSSDDNILSITQEGIVTSKNYGHAFITGTDRENKVEYVLDIYVEEIPEDISLLADNIPATSSKSYNPYYVYIDPGHGGSDPGAIGPTKYKESAFVLDVALKLKSKLENSGVIVKMCRTTDEFIDLSQRAQSANAYNSDIFISIHTNSFSVSSVTGTETFVHSSTGTRINESKKLADIVQKNMVNTLKSNNRGVKSEDFRVLRLTKMPAILAEIDFISNPSVESKMKTNSYKESVAASLHNSIMEYLKSTPPIQKPFDGIYGSRIFGQDRYLTSYAVSKQGWSNSEYAVIANGESFADGLSATPLASLYNAPVLLSTGSSLSSTLKSELNRLNVKKVFLIGGTGVISNTIDTEIKSLGIETKRLGGLDRYETSLQIANELGSVSNIVIASGESFPDALSIASIAGKLKMPILLTQTNRMPNGIKAYINNNKSAHKYIVGGTGVISDSIISFITNSTRLGGSNRYETNMKILNAFNTNANLSDIYVVSSLDFPDALSASALASRNGNPILLVANSTNVLNNFIETNRSSINNCYVLGSNKLITDFTLFNNSIKIN